MITIKEETAGRGTALLYPSVSTCLTFTFELQDELVGAHLAVASPPYIVDALIAQMMDYVKQRHIRRAYAIGMIQSWEARPAPTDGSSNYAWPAFADTVRERIKRYFPVYAFNARKAGKEVVVAAFLGGDMTSRFEVSKSKKYALVPTGADEDGEAMTLTQAKVKEDNRIVQGIKYRPFASRDVLVKNTSLGNVHNSLSTTHCVRWENCAEF